MGSITQLCELVVIEHELNPVAVPSFGCLLGSARLHISVPADVENQFEYLPAVVNVEDRVSFPVYNPGPVGFFRIQVIEDFLSRRHGAHVVQESGAQHADRIFGIGLQAFQCNLRSGSISCVQLLIQLCCGNGLHRAGGIPVVVRVFCPVDHGDAGMIGNPVGIQRQAVQRVIEFQGRARSFKQVISAVHVQRIFTVIVNLSIPVCNPDCRCVDRSQPFLQVVVNIADGHILRFSQVGNFPCIRVSAGEGIPSFEYIALPL